MPINKVGVLLMSMGGPNSLDEVEPYLADVRGGRQSSAEFIAELKRRYRLIGGRSPLLEITQRQAQTLENHLNRSSDDVSRLTTNDSRFAFKVYVGMRHWPPYIKDVLHQMMDDDIKEVVALCMAPHYSSASVGAYFKELEKAAMELGFGSKISRVKSWGMNTHFLQAIAGNIRASLELFNPWEREDCPVLFTAHSLPKRIIESGDPYEEELKASVSVVARSLNLKRWLFAYQSKSPTGEAWLGPSVEEVLDRLSHESFRSVLVVPIGFVCDHLEILYDVDILFKEYAKKRGIHLERTASLNDSPLLTKALASLVENALSSVSLKQAINK